ncbi:putative non-specific serine/threonine protein kinase [Helianthus annuus]|uniref:Serine/threonine-protein kinase TOR n=1 Tax=Helianthus annuus TaxID=4232 RepID=A0A251UXL8_HELAN|nr:serine/threonine-protein kinase TOR [Helianthus annuus]KAF5809366.1 putative non-specific serine/threonine protein kinase [Helianthus annuus]KAJ0580371.1 putative non-specific serine/threonine protein kinase [Helianthus annuus]KAJ0587885.1 putative non-specific serine/threonine protein kinase [Helianthus annuus]KAJ0596321.1 putative non-specific serine/threonine protein kinase [Helianthus annuus]KAJ0760713.1 putative non-specific serine/threonine protein kinase [Helianthus annuus]
MAAPPQSFRFGGPATTAAAAGNIEALNRVLADLCTRGNPKDGSALALRKHVEEEARALNGEAFSRFMDQLYDRITSLLESNDVADNLGALRATDELIDLKLGASGTKVSKFSNYMRIVFDTKRDPEILILASKVLGHLARSGGAMTADEVECQVKNALQWLGGERVEYRRFAAVLILKEMAENASTVFNVHVPEFVDAIWVALRDPTLAVRERAVEALRACLRVIEKRETRWRVQWYYRMFEATQDGLGKNASVHSIHGSLLAVGELLRNTGEFMMSRYREVAEIVLRYLEHRNPLVRLSITSLLPRIAHFLRDRFVTNYLTICMNHILAVLKIPTERASGFIALGEMAGALDGELVHYLPTITSHLREAIAPRRGRPSLEALACVGNIAKAMGPAMETHVRSLLDAMFSAGLSSVLVESLEQITVSIPSLLPTIQDRLLESISMVLSKPHNTQTKTSGTPSRVNTASNTQQVSELSGSALEQLALQTLARFNFKGHDLLEFARESVVVYLEDDDGATRKDAALCCCKLVVNSFSIAQFSLSRSSRAGGKRRRLIEEIVEKLLIAAVADADVSVRNSIFSSLHGNEGFDDFLAQADSLTAIFAALNDEDLQVREYAISVAGRLSEKNPAYVFPALRRHLIQLLTYLGQSADSKCREESAKLLGCLIRSCERLILPYIAPIHKALLAKLCEGTAGVNANTGIISGVLVTVGDLARVGGFAMREYIPELMPRIVEALLDGAAATKREVAVATLGQVVQSTGYVITPYNEYPLLLGLLLKLLNGELAWSTRREVLKVLGIMGALDPHVHKRNQQSLPGPLGDGTRTTNEAGPHIQSSDELPMDLWPSFATSEDYFSTVAINSLVRILRDPSLSSYHQKVVGSLMFIFKSMGLGCVPYLPKVLPDFFYTIRNCDDSLKEFITWKLGTLVSIVRQHIRKYLPELLSLISELWSSFSLPAAKRPVHGPPILHLVEQLCLALNDEFRRYLPVILPGCIQVLSDAERCNDYTYVRDILRTLEVFGGTLDEHMHLLLPALIRLFKVDASVDIRRAAIKTLIRLIPRVQVTGHISALVHHLKLVLDGKNDELRKDAVDALCCLAHALGEDFSIFIPSIHKLLLKHRLRHKEFEEIEGRLQRRGPLVGGSVAAQKSIRQPPVEVISDPLSDMENDPYEDVNKQLKVHQVNDGRLRAAGEASQRSTKEDWAEWMRHFSIELLKESPSPALRTCARLAQLQPFVGRELFAAGFVSCWSQLHESSQKALVRSLEMAFSSPNIPPEILATLLNLAEFMEHDEKPLPIDIRLLGALAEKCRAFAKALHYKEMEFEGALTKKMDANPVAVVEALIHINNQLHQHEAAVGILTYAQQRLDVQLKESWYEKLQRWDDALKAYTAKSAQASSQHLILDATLGRMRSLAALARWEELNNMCRDYWTSAEPAARLEMAPMAANAAWNMGEWDQMAEYVSKLDDGDETKLRVLGNTAATGDGGSNGTFFRAVLLVRRGKYDEAREYVERARKCLATELAALVLESYERAYSNMVRVQQLSELEEVIDYCTLPVGDSVAEGRRALIRNMWNERIKGTKRNVEVWQALLAVRSLVLPPTEDSETWLKFASLCRKSGRISQAKSTLIKLLQFDPETTPETVRYHGPPQVIFAYLKYQWSLGEDQKRKEAFARLQDLAIELSSTSGLQPSPPPGLVGVPNVSLMARVYLKLGLWQWALSPGLDDDSIQEILSSFRHATHCATKRAKAWHTWALFNTAVMSHYTLRGLPNFAAQFVVAAVTGYFHSIACAAHAKGVDDSLQDILRLLTLWFNHGATAEVQTALQRGFQHVNINTWLVVLPQIIARIHSNNHAVRELIQSLLVRIGQCHPQALMYPLLVACKSISNLRKAAAQEVVDKVRQHSGVLVDQAQLVSEELIRVAILWHEMWHEALEEASRLYFGEHNIEGMLKVLEPLHEMLEEGAMRNNTTIKEKAFIQTYHHELLEAYECCMEYKKSGKDAELTRAWDLYYHVFRRIDKQLQSLTTLDLQSVSPELVECRDLELAVPGTYRADSPVVTIASFAPQLVVITSKQRPRKLTIHGSDGEDYAFLLKGHEDLRQDERVMQLFGLVNTLLENSRKTSEKDLSIQRYEVIPLSPNSGLIGWVPNCDTLHQLIREYRDARKITLNQEHKYMLSFAPDYDHLPLVAKVEVFEYALDNTEGNDLARVLWLKSRTSEVWLDRRTNYTRSLAVMSMVGYLLGLGDRHPSNLMLHRFSGKILHIDFGDCFEASMNREKFPEKVPFRLTRMLVKAMEVSGLEGNFRSTCENVMQVLRTNKDSVMAMMEAFVHDPLINWRLFNFNEVTQMSTLATTNAQPAVTGEEAATNPLLQPQRGARERELLQAVHQLGDANEVLNERAVVVMARMSNKLTGRDFSTCSTLPTTAPAENTGLISGDTREADHGLSVKLQVQKLILQATSHENLCQNYVGWCPFW